MFTQDFSKSDARQFLIGCEATLQVARQLSFTDEPITLFFDSKREKSWVRIDATFPNRKVVVVFSRQIPRSVTLCVKLPAMSAFDMLWVTQPENVSKCREIAKDWPMLPRN